MGRDHSLKVVALDEKDRRSELIRRALDALALTLNGKPAAATTIARKRAVFYGALNYAVELDILPANPIGKVTWKAPEVAEEIDRRVVARPRQVREPPGGRRGDLTGTNGVLWLPVLRLHAPRRSRLPPAGRLREPPGNRLGTLLLTGNAPRVGSQWTDSGTPHDERHLKHRAKKTTRPVPVPPELVQPDPHTPGPLRHLAGRAPVPRHPRSHAQREQLRPDLAASTREGAHRCPGELTSRRTTL